MKTEIEKKLAELEAMEARSSFQDVARGCLLNAIGHIRNAELHLQWHAETEAPIVPPSVSRDHSEPPEVVGDGSGI